MTTTTNLINVSVETEGRNRGKLVIDMPVTWNMAILKLPGAKFDRSTRRFTVPMTWNSLLSLQGMAKKIQWKLNPDPDVREWGVQQAKAWAELTRASAQVRSGEKVDGYYRHQVDGATWLLSAPESEVGRLLQDETGCLTGDTMINVNRGGKGWKIRLDTLVSRMSGESFPGKSWDMSIPTLVQRSDGGVVRLGEVDKAWFSGVKDTFTLTTETGRTIRGSSEHPFSTAEGWKQVAELKVGDQLHVNTGRSKRGKVAPKAYYIQVYGMDAHPHRVRRSGPRSDQRGWKPQWAVAEHRLVVEAEMNGLDRQVFIDKIRSGAIDGLQFLEPAFDVHHRNRNTRDNHLENLQVLTTSEHHALHAREGKVNHVLEQVGTERLVSIVANGPEPTYDIRMKDEPHNFLANGFVVHNSGKTATVIRAIQEGKIAQEGPILIVAVESTMETGWARDFATWAPELRVEQVIGTITNRRKTLARLKAGEIDVAIIGHSNLKSHTRFEAYGTTGLKKCIACGGPRLTSGKVDEKGKPLPDIDPETGRKINEISEASCQKHTKELNEIPLQLVVVDEIHRCMNAQAQLTQAVWGVANYSADGASVPHHRRWGLTGTPVSKRSDQAWPPLHWISPAGWPTKGEWVSYFCLEETGWDGWPKIEKFQPDKIEEFQKTYSAVTRRVLKEQVLNLPPRIRWGSLERRVEMGTEQRKLYTSMRDEMLIKVQDGLVTAANAANLAGRLTMLASGCGRPDPANIPGGPQKMLMAAPSCKLDAIIADFKSGEFDGQQIGMTFAHSTVLHMIRKGLVEHNILAAKDISVIAGGMPKDEVDRAIKAFQAGKTRVVMLTYAKGGTGITLTAASTVLCVQRDWNPIANLQGMDRFYRIGSERHESINVFDYVTRGTNEIAQLRRLEENAQTLEEIVQDQRRLSEWFS